MNLRGTYRYLAIMVTALLLLLQGASLSHAATYGAGEHEHDGIVCFLSLQSDTQAILPAPKATPVLPALRQIPEPEFETNFIDAPRRLYRGREPPPRGPPSN